MMQYQNGNATIVISSLQKQVRRYKEEVEYWKVKYEVLFKQHYQLIDVLKKKKVFENYMIEMGNKQEACFVRQSRARNKQASIQLLQQQYEGSSPTNNKQCEHQFQHKYRSRISQPNQQFVPSSLQRKFTIKPISPFELVQVPFTPDGEEYQSPQRSPRLKEQDQLEIDFFSIQQIQKHTSCQQKIQDQSSEQLKCKKKKGFDLIEGYFIIQKIDNFRQNLKNHHLWIKAGNQFILEKEKNLLEIVYRYTFRQEPLSPIEDDPFNSRLNQIKYGTPYQELIYSFDNYQPNEEEESRQMFKSMRQKYVHCLIRPEITMIDGKAFQTEILYGFVSSFAFRTFFQDLHRTIQRNFRLNVEQIKFELLNSNRVLPEEVQLSKQMRIEIVAQLMNNLFNYSNKNCSNIQNYPIKLNIQTKVSNLKLEIESQEKLRQMERESLQILLKKYNLLKISKILHYVLTQKQLVIVSLSRKHLNEIFQIVRLIIKPFYWVFPIVYRYSDHFEPFLSSPLPLIIGIVFDFNNRSCKENKILMNNEFVTIFMEEILPQQKETFFFFSSNKPKHTPSDLRQLSIFQKDIQFLYKYLAKLDKKSKTNQSQRIQKYINRLKHLIVTGSLDCQLSPFMIEFLDAQMVQSFKDLLHGSNKKLWQHDQINEDMTMTT